jgi:ATP-dependent exoDNAse (exonuclease V) alpha subunit
VSINYPFYEKVMNGYEEIEKNYRNIIEPVKYAICSPIVFTQNDCNGHWVNGTRGIVTDIIRDNKWGNSLKIQKDGNETVLCSPTRHFLSRFIYNLDKNTVENQCVAVIRQFPFIPGYALTVHRAQGMTLDLMGFNTGTGMFAPGQLYVALSRVRDLEGLKLHVPIEIKDIYVSKATIDYFDIFTNRCTYVNNGE